MLLEPLNTQIVPGLAVVASGVLGNRNLRSAVKVSVVTVALNPLSVPSATTNCPCVTVPLVATRPSVRTLPVALKAALVLPLLSCSCNKSALWLIAPLITPPTLPTAALWMAKLVLVCKLVPFCT